jgi:NADH:ubiquinone oxidoreductase subunit C
MKDIIEVIKEKRGSLIIKTEQKSEHRIYLNFESKDISVLAKFLFKEMGCRFATATGIDTPSGIEILYHFSYDRQGEIITLRTVISDKKHPSISSITPIIRGAEWIEREMWELLGIDFVGHPNLKHLLLMDEWPEGKYPLRHEHDPST